MNDKAIEFLILFAIVIILTIYAIRLRNKLKKMHDEKDRLFKEMLVQVCDTQDELDELIKKTVEPRSATFHFLDEENDVIKKPKHYQGSDGLQAMEVIRQFIHDLQGVSAYCWGNTIKYTLRFQKKNGVEDLKKARQHLDWLIEEEKEKRK